jgi:hypothetical protein
LLASSYSYDPEISRRPLLAVLDTCFVRTALHYQIASGTAAASVSLAQDGSVRLFMERETLVETCRKLPKFAKDFGVTVGELRRIINEWLPSINVVSFGAGDGPGMFAFADPDRIRQILATAGWRDIEITGEHAPVLVGGGGGVDDAVEFLRTGSIGRTILAGADARTADRAIASVRAALTPYADAEGVRLGAAVWLARATAP